MQRGGVAYGLTLLSFTQDRRLSSMLVAERATHAGDHWMLEQVQLTELALSKPVEELHCAAGILRLPPTAHARCCRAETLPILQLWPYAQYLKQQGMVYVDIELAFWRKVSAIGYPRAGSGCDVFHLWATA